MDELTRPDRNTMDELAPAILARLRTVESRPDTPPANDALFDELRSLHERLNARDEAERRAVDAENTRIAHAAWGNFCNAWRRTLNPSTCPAPPHEDQKKWPPAGAHASPRGTDSTV